MYFVHKGITVTTTRVQVYEYVSVSELKDLQIYYLPQYTIDRKTLIEESESFLVKL